MELYLFHCKIIKLQPPITSHFPLFLSQWFKSVFVLFLSSLSLTVLQGKGKLKVPEILKFTWFSLKHKVTGSQRFQLAKISNCSVIGAS